MVLIYWYIMHTDMYIILYVHTVANQGGPEDWVAIASTINLNVIRVGKPNVRSQIILPANRFLGIYVSFGILHMDQTKEVVYLHQTKVGVKNLWLLPVASTGSVTMGYLSQVCAPCAYTVKSRQFLLSFLHIACIHWN